jgi:cytoskeletal protein CcmA (bactofilin family)
MTRDMDGKKQKGAALLMVLLIVMAITILSLGFLSRSDVELACGVNMALRRQMDYLAESGLEHARGLILYPQDITGEYWTGAVGLQLVDGGDDYYDVTVAKLGECNYQVTCDAYKSRDGQKTGRSGLQAELRLDPSIAFWAGTDAKIGQQTTINGDVYCNGTLTNDGVINGDVFANGLSGSILGQAEAVDGLSLQWPRVTAADFTSHYQVQSVGSALSSQTFGPYVPVRVCYHNGTLELAGDVRIEGMLVVEGDLIVRGGANVITAAKSLPAFLVTGDLVIDGGGQLDVYGLGVVDGKLRVSAGAVGVDVHGALFVQGRLEQITADSSGNGNVGTLYNNPTWRPGAGQSGGALEFDGVDDKVEDTVAGGYLNGLSAVTISFWVKSDVTGQDRGILFGRAPTGLDEDLGIRYDLAGVSGHGTRGITASIKTTSGYTQIESTSNVQTAAWQHLALVWKNGTSLKLYIDGQLNPLLYDAGPMGGTIAGVQKLMVGCGAKGTYWDGMIDDVRIYDRALDPNEIYPPVNGPANLVTHWKLDEQGTDVTITASPDRAAIRSWSQTGEVENWGSAAGAFYRSIQRQ